MSGLSRRCPGCPSHRTSCCVDSLQTRRKKENENEGQGESRALQKGSLDSQQGHGGLRRRRAAWCVHAASSGNCVIGFLQACACWRDRRRSLPNSEDAKDQTKIRAAPGVLLAPAAGRWHGCGRVCGSASGGGRAVTCRTSVRPGDPRSCESAGAEQQAEQCDTARASVLLPARATDPTHSHEPRWRRRG